MIYLEFLFLATIIVCGSIMLSKQADVIEQNSMLNAIIVGSILALATSLPELATGITSTLIGESAMSISNVLGSNIFNIMILAIMNIIFFNRVVYRQINDATNRLNYFTMAIYLLLTAVILWAPNGLFVIGTTDVTSILVIIIYVAGMILSGTDQETASADVEKDAEKLKKAIVLFIIIAAVILITSIQLAKVAELIMIQSGLSASFVGAVFIGVSTSLPELITCTTLVRLGSYDMAATGVLGSNLFNFVILAIVDIIDQGSLYSNGEQGTIILLSMGIFFLILTMSAIRLNLKNRYTNLLIPFTIVATYLYVLL